MAPTAGPAEHRTIAIEPLGAYSNLDPNGITVSGISPAHSLPINFMWPVPAS